MSSEEPPFDIITISCQIYDNRQISAKIGNTSIDRNLAKGSKMFPEHVPTIVYLKSYQGRKGTIIKTEIGLFKNEVKMLSCP